MSVKTSKPEKKKPRAMPVETIVTRFKSAQQKQLQENQSKTKQKNTKTKKVTPNIKSPERKSLRQKKVNQKMNKIPEKTIEDTSEDKINEVKVQNKEYYPNKLKRKVLEAKVFLAPKHSFKVVCGMKSFNKRKLHIPQRESEYVKGEIKQPCCDTNKLNEKQPELSIVDMVRMIEENGSLDDDDLLEILTCPSPVWWEETPDGYVEEPLFSRPQILDKEINKIEIKKEQNDVIESINNTSVIKPELLNVNIDSKDKNFINRRSKLEALLGNIKNKKPVIKNQSKCNVSNNKFGLKKFKSNSESMEEDLLEFHDDEILKHLENIDIPTEISEQKEEEKREKTKESKSRRESCDIDMTEEYLDLSLLDDDVSNEIKMDTLDNSASSNKDLNLSKDSKNELVTVYKILNSDDDSNEKDGKIKSYYKCKKNKIKSSEKIDTNYQLSKDNDSKNRSIVISESDKVKYCLVCSSIFNTNTCNYCLRKNLK